MLCGLAAAAGAWLCVLNAFVVATTTSVALGAEAALFGATGLVISVVAFRAARRARRRRKVDAVLTPEPVADDPMAWVRRRKFGARG
ncbi:MAG: hypothetical protein ACYDH6_13645 [Acidimicrobiales bacterium]